MWYRITAFLDNMLNNVLFSAGTELFFGLLDYLDTSAPQRAYEIRETYEEIAGTFDEVIKVAKDLAKAHHQGQVENAGKEYFTGHLCQVAGMGYNWKDKVVGYLHDAAYC